MRSSGVVSVIKNDLLMVLSVLAATTLLAGPAAANDTSALLYNYEFKGTTGIVDNSAPAGPVAPLTLSGAWTPVADGVHFSGDTNGNSSVAYGRPASGYTINVPATAAMGFGTRIVYDAPASGTCFADTPNITQIGRYSARSAQAKIQLSSCVGSETSVVIECRFAGSLTGADVHPVMSTLPLVNGGVYNISCVKSPDRKNNTATITLTVTKLDPVKGNQTVTNTFRVAALGNMQSEEYISAGNKYPVPAPAKNTDQFNGDITRAIYCDGTPAGVSTCLATYLPSH
jgi:surface glycoprotein (TIGR04207 family)